MLSSESDGGGLIAGLNFENFTKSIGNLELGLRLFHGKIGAYFETELNRRSEVLFAFVRLVFRIPLIFSLGIGCFMDSTFLKQQQNHELSKHILIAGQ
jgi:hypothetical protein